MASFPRLILSMRGNNSYIECRRSERQVGCSRCRTRSTIASRVASVSLALSTLPVFQEEVSLSGRGKANVIHVTPCAPFAVFSSVAVIAFQPIIQVSVEENIVIEDLIDCYFVRINTVSERVTCSHFERVLGGREEVHSEEW